MITDETAGRPSARWAPALRYGLPGLVAGAVLSAMVGAAVAPPLAAGPAGASGAGDGLIAMTAEAAGSANSTRLFLIDPRSRSFGVYRVDGLNGQVKLEAARQFGADLQLSEYNNLEPRVSAIEAMVATPQARPGARE